MYIRRWASKALFKLAGAIAPAPDPVAFTPVVKLAPKPRPNLAPAYPLQQYEDLVVRDVKALCMAQGRSYKNLKLENMSALMFAAYRQRDFTDDYPHWQTNKRVLPHNPDLYAWFMPASSEELVALVTACVDRLNKEWLYDQP